MKKIATFGMDGFIVPMMKFFAKEGSLPNFRRMIDEGTVNQTEPDFPVWTPTNWATLCTGAHTGTHGASRWSVDVAPGRRIDSFDGRAVNAERIWNALEREGMKSAAIHYPAAYPSGIKNGFVIDGFGHPSFSRTEYEIAPCQTYTTDQNVETQMFDHDGTAIRKGQEFILSIPVPEKAENWRNLGSPSRPILATEIEFLSRTGKDTIRLHAAILDANGRGYDTVVICREPDLETEIARAGVGRWSEWAVRPFPIDGRQQNASVRFKLLELSKDGRSLKLYRSQMTYADGFTHPPELARELMSKFGPYQEHASMIPYAQGMADMDTALEECEYQGLWFADVANSMLHEKGCSYFTCHWHLFDYINHICLNYVDPVCPGYDPATYEQYLDYFRRAYQIADRILGRLWEAADPETYVGVVSDHGAFPDVRVANIRKFLHERGFLVVKDGAENAVEQDFVSEEDIDWDRTTAYLKAEKGFDIYINAAPGPEFDRIERDLLLALRTWVDEEVGRTPIAIALPKRDAYLLKQWGDQCGDVVFSWDHGYVSGYLAQWHTIRGGGAAGAPEFYGAHHGGFLPTDNGFCSTFGTFILAGDGLKKGYERPSGTLGYIHAVDVVPTLCRLFGVDPPAQSQGAVAHDLLEGREMLREREIE